MPDTVGGILKRARTAACCATPPARWTRPVSARLMRGNLVERALQAAQNGGRAGLVSVD
jgi:hypothetical protein